MPGESLGAYGFRLEFAWQHEPPSDLVAVGPGAPSITVTRRDRPPERDAYEVSPDRVVVASPTNSGFVAQRDPATLALELSQPFGLELLIHPILTMPVSVFCRWRGDVTLHAGAFEVDAGAWVIAGTREAGKSTMLATLAAAGCPIVTDDLVVVQDGDVLAGPDCVDLRPDAARRFPQARSIGEVGGRERWRVSTPASASRLPLRGFFVLGWGDGPEIDVSPLPARDVLSMLFSQEYIGLMGQADPLAVLELGALPAWQVRRPRDWDGAQDVVASMLAATRGG